MARLIDANKLTADILALSDCPNGFSGTYDKACIIGMIEEQPTVDAPVWISVEDRLPEDTEDEFNCFITVTSSILNRFIMEAHYVNCLEEWSKEYAGERRGAWMAWDREDCEFFEVDNVIAWMPLPKPYEEKEHEIG